MTYLFAAIAALTLIIFLGSQRRRHHRPAAWPAPLGAATVPLGSGGTQAPALVAAGVGLALRRLAPVMAQRNIRTDVAVSPDLMIQIPGDELADLLEALFSAAIHQAPAGRMLVTALSRDGNVQISVTDDNQGANFDPCTERLEALSEKAALSGGTVDINVRSTEGTTLTLRLGAALGQPGFNAAAPGNQPPQHPATSSAESPVRTTPKREAAGLAGAA